MSIALGHLGIFVREDLLEGVHIDLARGCQHGGVNVTEAMQRADALCWDGIYHIKISELDVAPGLVRVVVARHYTNS